MKTTSKLFRLNFLEVLIGVLIAFFSAVLTALYDFVQNNHNFNELNWNLILYWGLGPSILFLLNQLSLNSKNERLKKEDNNEEPLN